MASSKSLILIAVMALIEVQSGCRTRPVVEPDMSKTASSLAESNPVIKADAVQVHFTSAPSPFSYQIKDVETAFDEDGLIGWLRDKRIDEFALISDYKFTRTGAEQLIAEFEREGFRISEFWVPRSTQPGWLNLVASRQRPNGSSNPSP